MKDIALRQLDRSMYKIKHFQLPERPKGGWISAIRDAIGMTHEQMAKRLKISAQGAHKLEASEKQYNISLNSLEKAAQALDCKLYYILLPQNSLERMVLGKLEEKAKKVVMSIDHNMGFEDQKTQQIELDILIEKLTESYKSKKNISFIWDDE